MEYARAALKAGRYEAVLDTRGGQAPVIELVHQERVVAVAEVAEGADGRHRVGVDLPAALMSDGVHVVAVRSAADGTVFDRITLLMGSELDGDFRSEIALLRDELELLKRAFRRHCAETGAD
ncbi:MAG: hypothetical protein AAF914_04660 [Pseudomonadota bacterium]